MRASPGAPIAVPAGVALATVALTTTMLVILWTYPALWWRASAAIPALSTWGFVAVLQLGLALAVVVPTLRPSRSALGLAPGQLATAGTAGLALWSIDHLASLVDIACTGRVPPPPIDALGDFLGAYGEELIYRVVVLGALATLLRRHTSERRALAIAVLGCAVLFWASHLPRDIVTGEISNPLRFAALVAHGVLLAAVYLTSGNVMLATVLHALGNGPMLIFAGAHHAAITVTASWLFAIGLVVMHGRSVPAKHG